MDWRRSLSIALVYVGTVVGAGFASGREIVEFFSKYGFSGMIGIFFSGCLFMYFGRKIMILSIRIRAKNFDEFNRFLFGPALAPLVTFIQFLMLIGVTSVMLSGTAAVFEEQLRLPGAAGLLLTVLLAGAVITMGKRGVVFVNGMVVPLLVLFSFALLWKSAEFGDFPGKVFSFDGFRISALNSAVAYAAFNIALAQGVLVPAAAEIDDVRTVKLGGLLGGAILTAVMLASHFVLVQLPDPASFQIPMGAVIGRLAGSFYFLYILVIYGEIFTTIIGNVYGLERFLQTHFPGGKRRLGLFIFFSCLLLSLIPYGTLLGFLYPLFGYVSLIYFLFLLLRGKRQGE